MPDPIVPANPTDTDNDMPQGEALDRAEAELDALGPGPTDTPHFAPADDPEQPINETVHDLLGRRDGP